MMLSLPIASVQLTEVAQELSVSLATVRNWIKTGKIVALSSSTIDATSYVDFKKNTIGTQKLNKRANKTQTQVAQQLSLVTHLAIESISANGDELSLLYEQSLSNTIQNVKGIYYTPLHIVADMFTHLPVDSINAYTTFCDPCCGTGNFLLGAVDAGISPGKISGFDIDPQAIQIAQNRFFQKTGYFSPNIQCVDSVKAYLLKNTPPQNYDIVMTNPPWGKNPIKPYTTLLPSKILPDACILFTELCLSLVKQEGLLGLLLPDAYFNIASFQSIRTRLLTKKLLVLLDYGKPFKGLQARAEAIILQNKALQKATLEETVTCIWEKQKTNRKQQSFLEQPEHIFNFHITQQEEDALQHVLSKPYETLKNKAAWGMGIVTGDNQQYVSSIQTEDYTIPVYKGADIKQQGLIALNQQFLKPQFQQFQQVAPLHLYQAPKKIVYRFISDSLRFALDDQQRFFLNSANFFILEKNLGIKDAILVHYLNSRFMNWVFKSLYRTHKVLRKDLEQLPLFLDFLTDCTVFDEQALHHYLDITEQPDGTFRLKRTYS
ncbi:MAG: N-6 DNA methylase [Candidatus Melainabacteria bacterium]|nr:N-6 DNA methylase [Candidatus Melainabacteria bacterium]